MKKKLKEWIGCEVAWQSTSGNIYQATLQDFDDVGMTLSTPSGVMVAPWSSVCGLNVVGSPKGQRQ